MSEETGKGPMTVNAFTNKWCPRGDVQDHDCQMGKDLEGMIESLSRKAALCEKKNYLGDYIDAKSMVSLPVGLLPGEIAEFEIKRVTSKRVVKR